MEIDQNNNPGAPEVKSQYIPLQSGEPGTKPDTDVTVPDRHYHHEDPETPDSAHIEEIDPDVAENLLKNIDSENAIQNNQNQDSITQGLKSQEDD